MGDVKAEALPAPVGADVAAALDAVQGHDAPALVVAKQRQATLDRELRVPADNRFRKVNLPRSCAEGVRRFRAWTPMGFEATQGDVPNVCLLLSTCSRTQSRRRRTRKSGCTLPRP